MKSDFINPVIRRIASIDLGTNSFHAVIVDIHADGSFYTIDKLKEMVLLAEKGVGERLSEAAMKRGLEALQKIKTLCDHQNTEQILAFATSAIREAENGGEFIQRAIDEVGLKINAIPGRVEAELIGLAVQHGVKLPVDKPALMMDIGGGSVEFIIADREKFHFLASKKLGVARMAAKFVDHDPVTVNEIETLKQHFKEKLEDVAQAFAGNRTKTLIGSSGTMENIAAMIAYKNDKIPSITLNELEFTAKQFFKFHDKVIRMSRDERARLKGLDEKRIDLLIPGLVLVNYMLKTFAIKKVIISSQALREGIIIRYIQRELPELKKQITDPDPRRRSVFELLHKCHWHETHSRHVTWMALKIFDALQDDLGLSDQDRELLEFASYLHDIGYHISHRKHHKHALYLIRNADLKGFKEEEIEVMANVARYHRRSTPKSRHKYFDRLSDDLKKRVMALSAILRVADGLDRSHYQNVRKLAIEKDDERITFKISTESDPDLEIWGAMRKNNLFEEITGKTLEIEPVETGQVITAS